MYQVAAWPKDAFHLPVDELGHAGLDGAGAGVVGRDQPRDRRLDEGPFGGVEVDRHIRGIGGGGLGGRCGRGRLREHGTGDATGAEGRGGRHDGDGPAQEAPPVGMRDVFHRVMCGFAPRVVVRAFIIAIPRATSCRKASCLSSKSRDAFQDAFKALSNRQPKETT
jgi:hypothetical protein